MKRNNITILILGILILINLINTEKICNCEKKFIEQNENDNNENESKKNLINNDYTEDYNEYDDEEDEKNDSNDDNEDYTEESDNVDESIDSNDSKKKRQIMLPKRRRQKHILNMIPFHRVPVIMYNAVSQTLLPNRKMNQPQGAELTRFAKGLSKAIRTRHLSGFVGGLGLHAADFADHLVEVSKDVIDEHERKTRSNKEMSMWGKLTDRMKLRSAGLLTIHGDDSEKKNVYENINIPFENVGSTVRNLVDLIPSERTKRYYYKHYEPIASEIKQRLNSTQIRSLLRNTYESDIFSISNDPLQRSTRVSFQKIRTKRCKKKKNI